jgi:hypothetical protein
VQESCQREHRHEERNHRGDDLKRDRARVRQQVMLLETVQQRPAQFARSERDLQVVSDPPSERHRRGGGRADATRRDLTDG